MTSNVGSQYMAEAASSAQDTGQLTEGVKRQVTEALRQHFRPEFINRVDDVIFFHALGLDHMKMIVDIQIRGLLKRHDAPKTHLEPTDYTKPTSYTHLMHTTTSKMPQTTDST